MLNKRFLGFAWLFFTGLLLATYFLSCQGRPSARVSHWKNIRDGVFYINKSASVDVKGVRVTWSQVWQADAQQERLYFQDPYGSLLKLRTIKPTETSGTEFFRFTEHNGHYRLEIPGYSFRKYNLQIRERLATVFEPVKLHFSASVPSGTRLYFKVPARHAFSLGGKYYGGVKKLIATNVANSKQTVTLHLRNYSAQEYSRHDLVTIPAHKEDRIWSLVFKGSGKVSFWLDGIPNLFSLRKKDLFVHEYQTGTANINVASHVVGTMPKVGAALPFAMPPANSYPLLKELKLKSANYYIFKDVLENNILRDHNFRSLYKHKFNILDDISILANSGRVSVLKDIEKAKDFINKYFENRPVLNQKGISYIAFADEPNLNYSSYKDYENYFRRMAQSVKNNRQLSGQNIKIAAPASSRMVNGPTRSGSAERKGLDWTKKLLKKHPHLVDAVSWHEWLIRDLIATPFYRDTVKQVVGVVGRDPVSGKPLKDLIIAQTNISSGLSLSPYEQDTFFAALWWVSVVINASVDGDLAMINWFKVADDKVYKKGLVTSIGGKFIKKPVAYAMSFINEFALTNVLQTSCDAIEVDVIALTNKEQSKIHLLGVNKSQRQQKMYVIIDVPKALLEKNPMIDMITLRDELKQKITVLSDVPIQNRTAIRLNLPRKTIFVIRLYEQVKNKTEAW